MMILKKTISLAFFLFSISAFSQQGTNNNMVKVNVSAFAFKGFGVQYERKVSEKISVALGYSMIPKTTLPYKSYIEKEVFIPDVDLGQYKIATSIFTPEVRFYFGQKGAFHGFYLAPYARVGTYKIDGPIVFQTDQGEQSANFSGKVSMFMGGLMVGSSWQLSEKLYLDWWIIGGSLGGESGKFTTAYDLSPSEQEALQGRIESISLRGITLKAEVNQTGAVIRSSGNMVGVRGFGLNLGIRF